MSIRPARSRGCRCATPLFDVVITKNKRCAREKYERISKQDEGRIQQEKERLRKKKEEEEWRSLWLGIGTRAFVNEAYCASKKHRQDTRTGVMHSTLLMRAADTYLRYLESV